MVFLVVVGIILAVLIAFDRMREWPEQICTRCYQVSEAKPKVQGSFLIEVILWLAFIIPGIIYSVWRMTTKRIVCPACNSAEMVPTDTVRGKVLLEERKKLSQSVGL
jgi:hypothetical protein